MRIGFFVINPLSEGLGFSLRPYMLIKYLSLLEGVEIHVFTPFIETLRLRNTYFHKLTTSIPTELTNIVYRFTRNAFKSRILANSFIYRKFTLDKILHSLAESLREALTKNPVDILQAEQDIPVAAATKLKKYIDIPIVGDFHDMWAYEEISSQMVSPNSSAFEAINYVTKQAVESSDLVLVVNQLLENMFEARFSVRKVAIIPNGGELYDLIQPTKRIKRVVYAGNFEKYECVDIFIECLPLVLKEEKNLDIQIYGKGPEERNLVKMARKLNLPPSIFRGYVKREALMQVLTQSWVGVITTKKNYATPMKLMDYLSVGLPVVISKDVWISPIIEKYNAGKVSESTPEKYAEAILSLINTQDIELFSAGALKIIKDEYNWSKITKYLKSQYEMLI